MKTQPRRRYWLAVTVVMVILVGSLSGLLPLDEAARRVIQPVGTGLSAAGRALGLRAQELWHIGNLSSANRQLQAENDRLQSVLGERDRLAAENQQLRELVGWQAEAKYEVIGAEVIGYQADGIRLLVKLNRGSKSGVKAGQSVLAGGGLLGVIKQVDPTSSLVLLVTDPQFRALALTQTSRTPGLVKGGGPAAVAMERIPRDTGLKVDETVVTSGLDGAFPPGLLIGRVTAVEPAPEAIFDQARIEPAASAPMARLVVILK